MKAFVIIAAGGLGQRMKLRAGESKQYLKLARRPVLYHTIQAFEQTPCVSAIAIATAETHRSVLKALVQRGKFAKVHHQVSGGAERQDSIYNALQALLLKPLPNDAVILIHDGARPFIQPDEITSIAKLAYKYGACVPATKPKDTIKTISEDGIFFGETLNRAMLRHVQTPQAFRADLITEAHQRAHDEKFYATDDAALIEKYFPNQPIKIFETGYHNLKLTTPEDLPVAKAIWKMLREKKFGGRNRNVKC
jgi:2-C-methyl-D-erythritol 4-phosphate cytidylyltransferase